MKVLYDVTVGNGEYRIVYTEDMYPQVFRHGEPWDRDILGDGMILALVQEIADLLEWQEKAFKAEPNIDLQIERI